jgi:hypothetical protein
MPFYHQPHPWRPGYAIPKYVLAEPPGRGTFTTQWLPRRTISNVMPKFAAVPESKPEALSGSNYWAVPDYVLAEPPGRGTFTTKWLPRRLAPTIVPDYIKKPALSGLGATGATSATSATNYELVPLGGLGNGDPIKAYGERAAEWIVFAIKGVPADERAAALRTLLDTVDKSLWVTVSNRATKLKAKGVPVKVAMQRALASSLSDGMAKELIQVGKGNKIKKVSLLGLGVYDDAPAQAMYEALGAWWNPVDWAKSAASGIKKIGKTTWGTIKGTASSAKSFVGKGLEKLGALACAVANNPAAGTAAAGAATASGAPPQAGAAGVAIAQGLCAKEEQAPATQEELTTPGGVTGAPGWVLPAAIGGAALVLVLVLRK